MSNAEPIATRPSRPATPSCCKLDPSLAASPLVGAVQAIAERDDAWARFACPHCGKRNKCPGEMRGKVVACARCEKAMTVPAAHAVPAVEVPPLPMSSSTVAALVELSTAGAAASKAKPKSKPAKAWPWWLIVAHLSLPIGTVATLAYLKMNGYLPGLQIGW